MPGGPIRHRPFFAASARKLVRETTGAPDRAISLSLGYVTNASSSQLAIAGRDARFVVQPRRRTRTPAITADDAAYAVGRLLPSIRCRRRDRRASTCEWSERGARRFYRSPRRSAMHDRQSPNGGSIEVASQLAGAFRSAKLVLRTGFDLADALARQAERVADFLQGPGSPSRSRPKRKVDRPHAPCRRARQSAARTRSTIASLDQLIIDSRNAGLLEQISELGAPRRRRPAR